jgi:hypothetical protein
MRKHTSPKNKKMNSFLAPFKNDGERITQNGEANDEYETTHVQEQTKSF